MASYPVAATVCLVLMAVGVGVGLRQRRRQREPRLRRALGWFGIVAWIIVTGYQMLPEVYHGASAWPLHLCDIAALLGPIAFLMDWRLGRTLLYFWAFALTTQAFVTPELTAPPTSLHYWTFWLNHLVVVGLAVYDVAVGGYRPRWRDVWITTGITGIWAAAMLGLNLLTGWNYGYVGPGMPARGSILDYLGPWPQRLIWMTLLAIVAYLIVFLPWPIAARFQRAAR